MSDKITVRLVTPEELVFSREFDSAILPGTAGAFAVLPRRAPLIADLMPGVLVLKSGTEVEKFFITSGTAEVSDNLCNILVESAIASDKVRSEVLEKKLADLKAKYEAQASGLIKAELEDHITFVEMILSELHKDEDK